MSVSDLNYPGNAASRPRALAAPAPGISLWWCELDDAATVAGELASWLSPEEHRRAERFASPSRARRYIAGRAALRWLLARRIGTAPRDVPIQRGERGRPRLALDDPFDFNVSNTRDIALIAISDVGDARVGVDVEHVEREVNHDRLARKFLTERERTTLAAFDDEARRRAFLRLWTFKEAMSKATGEALGAPLGRLDVSLAPPRLVAGPPPYDPDSWTLYDAAVPTPYTAAVALWQCPPVQQPSIL